jgi:hypothetical protein
MKPKRTALVDPKAGERLAAAAKAAGVATVADLVDLVVDSGALALPPADGVSEVYTLENLGAQMHAQMPAAPARRHEWFEGLVDAQRIALVTLLRARGYSSMVISRDFGIHELEVNKIFARYADDLGAQVVNVRLNTLVGNMQLVSERAAEGAMQKDDWATYWRIQKELIAMLQSLGIVKQAIRKVEVAHKFEDQQKAEVDALLELERKQRERREEIKQAQVISMDAVPALELPAPASMEEKFEDDEDQM